MNVATRFLFAFVGTLVILFVGCFLYIVGAAFMTGVDLKIPSNLRFYLAFITLLSLFVLTVTYLLWAVLYRWSPFH